MIAFFKLIRYQNLLMLALMQLIIRYGFLKTQNISLALADWQFVLLVLSTVLIAAAGYIINDVFDQETDGINRGKNAIIGKAISENNAYTLYAALNITGVAIGFYLSNVILRPGFAAVFIGIAATLYLYATSFKQMFLLGNLIVALLLSMSVIIIIVFDLFPVVSDANRQQMSVAFSVLADYAIFAFIINFIREIIKDLEDVNGDYNQGMNTLPIALGVNRTTKLTLVLSVIPIFLLLFYVYKYYFLNDLYIAVIYAVIFVISPLIYFCVNLLSAKKKEDFHHLSMVLKAVIFFGILSIAVVSYNIIYNG